MDGTDGGEERQTGFWRWETHLQNPTSCIKKSMRLNLEPDMTERVSIIDRLTKFPCIIVAYWSIKKLWWNANVPTASISIRTKSSPVSILGQTGKVLVSVEEKSLQPWVITSVQNLSSAEHLLHQWSSKDAEGPNQARLQRRHLTAIWQPTQM